VMGMNPSTGMMMNDINKMKKQYNNFKMWDFIIYKLLKTFFGWLY
jgi:hypothetical protein